MSRFEFTICTATSHPALPGHFPNRPVVPGVLLIDQVLAKVLELSGLEAARLLHIKFSSALGPGECADVLFEVDGEHAVFRVTMQRHGKDVALASGKMLMRRKSNEALD
jgi:3-hydroxymyristoyl/3-hydroxydecanoyl-(acyl carrier protein) dehydratase